MKFQNNFLLLLFCFLSYFTSNAQSTGVRIETYFNSSDSTFFTDVVRGKENLDYVKISIKTKSGFYVLFEFEKNEIPNDSKILRSAKGVPLEGIVYYEVKVNGLTHKSRKGKMNFLRTGVFFETEN